MILPSISVTSQCTNIPGIVHLAGTQRSEDNNFAMPAETIAKIQFVMGDVLKKSGNPALKLHYSQNVNRVFEHNEIPGFVFKTTVKAEESEKLYNRIKNMDLAREIIKTHNLGLLVIPKAQVFQISHENHHYTMVAEEKLCISTNQGVQEREFEEHQDKLDKAIQQLSLFICKSGYDDVAFRNNPVIQNETDNTGNRKLGLIDLETTRGAVCGLNNLISLASNTHQIELIKDVAKTHLPNNCLNRAVTQRVHQLEENSKIDQFHRQKEIADGAAPLSVDSNTLGLDITEEATDNNGIIIKMGSVIDEFVNAINKQLAQSDPELSLRKRRYIQIRLRRIPALAGCLGVGLPKGMLMDTSGADAHMWIPRIIKSLIQNNHIFKAEKVTYDQYLLQA